MKLKTTPLAYLASLVLASQAMAWVSPLSGWIGPGEVRVTSTSNVSYDPDLGLYTYEYKFTNEADSLLDVDSISLLTDATVLNIVVPAGWDSLTTSNVDGDSVVSFYAGVTKSDIPPDFVDVGQLFPSPHDIKPGQSLGGFSFQSADPPDFVEFEATGFTQAPKSGIDVPETETGDESDLPDYDAPFKGKTRGPTFKEPLFLGGRRPKVDGFLSFVEFKNRTAVALPFNIEIGFAVNGETVYEDSFRAYLNNHEVTHLFKPVSQHTRRAEFITATNILKSGRNVLLTTVEGLVPDTTRRATDVDRVVFTLP